MKFTAQDRRVSDREKTPDWQQQDVFTGIGHGTTAATPSHVTEDTNTPRPPASDRILAGLEDEEPPKSVSKRSPQRLASTPNPKSGSSALRSPVRRDQVLAMENAPQFSDHSPQRRPSTSFRSDAGPSSPLKQESDLPDVGNETSFVVETPAPVTQEVLFDQQIDESVQHRKAQAALGRHRRGFIGSTQYSRTVGKGVTYRSYYRHLEAGTPIQNYTQVLIWCLQERLTDLNGQKRIDSASLRAQEAIENLIWLIANEKVSLNWARPGQAIKKLEDEESQRSKAPNPVNERNRAQIGRMEAMLQRLKEENAQWIDLLKQAEHEEDAHKILVVDKQTVELPSLDIDDGLRGLCAKIAGLGLDVEEAERSIARRKREINQDPVLLEALFGRVEGSAGGQV